MRCAGAPSRLPFTAGTFDAIVSNSTLDHLPTASEVAAALVELARSLKLGGRLLLTLDNPANPLIGLRNRLPQRLLMGSGLTPYPMGATLGPRPLAAAVAAAGLHLVELDTLVHCPRVLAVALAGRLDARGATGRGDAFVRFLLAWEWLGRLPTRLATGHYLAALALKESREGTRVGWGSECTGAKS